ALGCKSLHAHPAFARNAARARLLCRSMQCAGGRNLWHWRASARQAISRRLASAGIADPSDLKSPSLPGASPGSPTNLRSSSYGSASRRVVNREQQTGSTQDRTALGVQVSPRRPIWNVNRASEPGLGANECVPAGKWRKSTTFRHFSVDRPHVIAATL